MEFLGHALAWFSIGAPLLGCACGWWFWATAREDVSIPFWRRVAGLTGLIAVTTSIAFGGFAWTYWRRFPGSNPRAAGADIRRYLQRFLRCDTRHSAFVLCEVTDASYIDFWLPRVSRILFLDVPVALSAE